MHTVHCTAHEHIAGRINWCIKNGRNFWLIHLFSFSQGLHWPVTDKSNENEKIGNTVSVKITLSKKMTAHHLLIVLQSSVEYLNCLCYGLWTKKKYIFLKKSNVEFNSRNKTVLLEAGNWKNVQFSIKLLHVDFQIILFFRVSNLRYFWLRCNLFIRIL